VTEIKVKRFIVVSFRFRYANIGNYYFDFQRDIEDFYSDTTKNMIGFKNETAF